MDMKRVTLEKLKALVAEAGSVRAAARKAGVGVTTLRDRMMSLKARELETLAYRSGATRDGRFALAGVRLLERRPADSIKGRFYGLRRGTGYMASALAREWGISLETLRRHAREYGALRYVEVSVGNYDLCVVHPDTPKEAV